MTSSKQLLTAYDEQLRTDPETPSAIAVDRLGPLRLVTFAGGRGFVTYQDLDGASAQTIAQWVVEALAFYRKDPAILRVEWKTRGHQPDSVSRPTIGMFAGGGMGLMYPRLSVMTLALSTKDTEGFNSSAMSISDSLGGALALAATVIGVAAVAVAPRVAVRRQQQRQN